MGTIRLSGSDGIGGSQRRCIARSRYGSHLHRRPGPKGDPQLPTSTTCMRFPHRSALLVATTGLLLAVAPAQAQDAATPQPKKKKSGLGKVLDAVDKATRPPAGAGAGAAPGAGERPQAGAAIRVLSLTVEGTDTLAARFRVDSSTRIAKATVRCGAQRACPAGWDLRVLRTSVPGTLLPKADTFPLTVAIVNRGRVTAPASEMAVCLSGGSDCGERLDIVPIPALASGDTLVLVRRFALDAHDRDGVVRVEIDPDHVTEASDRTNDVGMTSRWSTTAPEFQWVAAEAPAATPAGKPLEVLLRIRNKSTVAASAPVELQLGNWSGCGFGGGDSRNRLVLPALQPRQTAVVRLHAVDFAAANCRGDAYFSVSVDPDRTAAWGAAHESESPRRAYLIR